MNLGNLEFKAEDFDNLPCEECSSKEFVMEMAAKLVNQLLRERLGKALDIDELVSRFLAWPLPETVCSDSCVVTERGYPHRIGTNLLTADETRQMLEHVLDTARLVCIEPIGSPEPKVLLEERKE